MKLAERTFKRKDYKKTSPYGVRKHPITGVLKMHNGVDYGTQGQKWEQYALEDGIVESCGFDSAGANAIFAWVRYPRLGIKVLHYHLDALKVVRNQRVNENTVIGTTGTTGNSTGVHLHMGVKYLSSGKYFDPESFDYVPKIEGSKDKIEVGDKVKIIGLKYATGQNVPDDIKKRIFTVSKASADKVLLKEIISWVWVKDVVEV